jgi:hypothetical protein
MRILVTILYFLIVFFNKAQTTISIKLNQGSGEDAYLASGAPTTNYGSHPRIGGNTWTCGGTLCLSRGVFKFDLSAIPTNAVISSATLNLYADLNSPILPTYGGPDNLGYLSRITSNWSENTVTWNSQPSTTAINQILITGSVSDTQSYSLNVLPLVKDMIMTNNYGFMINMQDEFNYYKSLLFASSDNIDTSRTPELIITYLDSSMIDSSLVNQTISLCNGNSADAYLASGAPINNYRSHPRIGGNTWTCGGDLCLSRGLFKFDLSAIPLSSTITSATLNLYADINSPIPPTSGGPNNAANLYRITSPWVENAVTWNTQPSYSLSNNVVLNASLSNYQNYQVNVTNLLNDMLLYGNYGFMLKMQDEVNYYLSMLFASSDNGNSALCPTLNIVYSSPTKIKKNVISKNVSVLLNSLDNSIKIVSERNIGRVLLIDMFGKTILNEVVGGNEFYLKNEIQHGLYSIQVLDELGFQMLSQKIIK